MEIYYDRYKITSSNRDVTVAEVKIGREGTKNEGEEYLTDHTYHPDMVDALNNVLKRGLLSSDATTLYDLLNELKEARNELRKVWESECTLK